MIARRDLLRFSLLALLPAGVVAAPGQACTIGAPRLSAQRIAPDGLVEVDVDVANHGARHATSLACLCPRSARLGGSSAAEPRRRAARHSPSRRTPDGPLPSRTRSLSPALPVERGIVEPGLFDIMVGTNSRDLQSTTLEIV